ncbi:hypothetical protein SAMN06265355_101177 [Actinomadura mexicana]|uniref:Uncharacterized protein n=1 Tax=Actinomadura mexicana TaxID=134959 RepID=A0A238UN76_9ACTN|nr:hypothetical protein SAMN06265355_101177 [Actinomadura mexicana]
MASAQVPETIIGPRWVARCAATIGANGHHGPAEGV